jgi:hypothetical protein
MGPVAVAAQAGRDAALSEQTFSTKPNAHSTLPKSARAAVALRVLTG